MASRPFLLALVLLLALCVAQLAAAGERIPGPVLADVVRIVDGDTIDVTARAWIGP